MADLLQGEKQFHLQTASGDVGKYVILPGDPGRVPKIAACLKDARQIAYNREYNTYTGLLDGEPVSVVSTGIGGPSAAIAVEELVKCGAHTFIRVGTSGGIDLKVIGGDLLIASAAVRGDGTSGEYLPPGYPAAADFTVLKALEAAAKELSRDEDGKRYHVGIIQSKDSFYGETNPETMPIAEALQNRWQAYVRCGCLTSEMEAAAVYSVAIARHVRAGAVLTALWNVERSNAGMSDPICNDSTRAIQCAVGAVRKLIAYDKGQLEL